MSAISRWRFQHLRALATINYGRSAAHILSEDGEYPVVGTGDTERRTNHYVHDGDSVILGRKGSIDKVSFVSGRFWAIDTAYFLSGFSDITARWLCHFLETVDLRKLNEATGVPSLSRDQLYKIVIPVPSRIEQLKVSEILRTVDRTIELTEGLMAKQQRLKAGLMYDLLTRGIDKHGNLRTVDGHPFKDSPLGQIPADWGISKFLNCTLEGYPIGYGIVQPGTYDDQGVKVAGIYTLASEFRDWHMSSVEIDQAYRRSRIRQGDVLLSVKGTTGKIGIVPKGAEGNISREIARIRLNDKFEPAFVRFLLLASHYQTYLRLAEVGTTRAELSIKIIRELFLVIPPRDEQERIVESLVAAEDTFSREDAKLSKLRSLKTALMQDLLTGRKRVTALLERDGDATVPAA